MNNSKILYEIRELSSSKTVDFHNLSKGLPTDEIKPGQIWSTHSSFQLPNTQQFQTDEPRLIVILQGEGKPSHKFDPISVAPLSIHISMASEYDYIVKQESGSSPLTFDFMVEVWNESPALKGQLNRFICPLSREATENLRQLYWSRLLNTEIPENLRKYAGLKIIAEDDPRIIFQEEEIAAVTYLANAATASLEFENTQQEETEINIRNWRVLLNVRPIWTTLSAFLYSPLVARAANNIDTEVERWLIVWPEKREESFIFELLKSPRQPYDIYIKTHSLISDFEGFKCVISVKTRSRIFYSNVVQLNMGTKIEVGRDPHFRFEDVESVEVAIEPK